MGIATISITRAIIEPPFLLNLAVLELSPCSMAESFGYGTSEGSRLDSDRLTFCIVLIPDQIGRFH